jgi:hypothetical protein
MNSHCGAGTAAWGFLMGGLIVGNVGCSGGSGAPETYPVTGVVTQGGKPVEGAVLAFVPADAEGTVKPIGGQAQSGADGTFNVQATFDAGRTMLDGLPAGDYKVTVTKMEMPAGEPSMARPPKNVLPAQYAMPESTPVSAKVTPEGPNRVDVAL